MDEQAFELLMSQIKEMRKDINELLRFKYWFIGAGAAVSVVTSWIVTYLTLNGG